MEIKKQEQRDIERERRSDTTDPVTDYLSNKVKEEKISLIKMSEKTGIPYGSLYNSLLHKKRNREIRGWELLLICDFLNVDLNELKQKTDRGAVSIS